MFNHLKKMQMEEKDDILENRIKFLENILKTYNRLSEESNVSWRSREETENEILDRLSKLYKKRKKK